MGLGMAVLLMAGCEGAPILGGTPKPPPDAGYADDADAESKNSALVIGGTDYYVTVPGQNRAESSEVVSCHGWSYRMLFSWEQHRDPASPTGWYAAIGPSNANVTGTIQDVSADSYLQCATGILPADHGTLDDGRAFSSRLLVQGLNITCHMVTVWPASWHLPNPDITVILRAYDYVPSSNGTPGELYLSLSSYALDDPGNGRCGQFGVSDGRWVRMKVTTGSKWNLPPPPPPPPPMPTPAVPCMHAEDCL